MCMCSRRNNFLLLLTDVLWCPLMNMTQVNRELGCYVTNSKLNVGVISSNQWSFNITSVLPCFHDCSQATKVFQSKIITMNKMIIVRMTRQLETCFHTILYFSMALSMVDIFIPLSVLYVLPRWPES